MKRLPSTSISNLCMTPAPCVPECLMAGCAEGAETGRCAFLDQNCHPTGKGVPSGGSVRAVNQSLGLTPEDLPALSSKRGIHRLLAHRTHAGLLEGNHCPWQVDHGLELRQQGRHVGRDDANIRQSWPGVWFDTRGH